MLSLFSKHHNPKKHCPRLFTAQRYCSHCVCPATITAHSVIHLLAHSLTAIILWMQDKNFIRFIFRNEPDDLQIKKSAVLLSDNDVNEIIFLSTPMTAGETPSQRRSCHSISAFNYTPFPHPIQLRSFDTFRHNLTSSYTVNSLYHIRTQDLPYTIRLFI